MLRVAQAFAWVTLAIERHRRLSVVAMAAFESTESTHSRTMMEFYQEEMRDFELLLGDGWGRVSLPLIYVGGPDRALLLTLTEDGFAGEILSVAEVPQ